MVYLYITACHVFQIQTLVVGSFGIVLYDSIHKEGHYLQAVNLLKLSKPAFCAVGPGSRSRMATDAAALCDTAVRYFKLSTSLNIIIIS